MNPPVHVITPTIPGREKNLDWCRDRVEAAGTKYPGAVFHGVMLDDPPHEDWGVNARLREIERFRFSMPGELVAYADDDVTWRDHHLWALVEALLTTKADFVYSRMAQHGARGEYAEVGEGPPRLGGIDVNCIVHRRDLLEKATWRPAGYASDWDLVERWLRAGATWYHLPLLTLDYH